MPQEGSAEGDTARLATRSQAQWDARLQRQIVSAADWALRHWLAVVNLSLIIFVSLPLLAPVLMANGYATPARIIYVAYRLTCHQMPERSFFVGGEQVVYSKQQIEAVTDVRPLALFAGSARLGYKVAICERDVAIYLAVLAVALLLSVVRRLPRLPMRWFFILLVPMAIDGLSQLTGLRESTWLLRVLTGSLFGISVGWLLFPTIDEAVRDVLLSSAARAGRRTH
jgi:uncharacterized membrane protein